MCKALMDKDNSRQGGGLNVGGRVGRAGENDRKKWGPL